MTDLHAHVLPGLDDGPKTVQDTVDVLHQASEDGTRTIVSVAHANDHHYEVGADAYQSAFRAAQELLQEENLGIEIVPAMEVRIGLDLVQGFREGRYLSIGQSGYCCIELSAHDFPVYALDVMYQLTLDGYRILLIHPERNRGVRKIPEIREKLMGMGVLGVASSGSLLGQFGAEVESAAMELMDQGLIQSVASDGHAVVKRPLRLSPAREMLARRYGEEEASWMMDEVPELVLAGHNVDLHPRQRIGWRRWLGRR